MLDDGDAPECVETSVGRLVASRGVLMTLVQLLKLSVTKLENVMEMATLSELHAAKAPGPGAVRRVPRASPCRCTTALWPRPSQTRRRRRRFRAVRSRTRSTRRWPSARTQLGPVNVARLVHMAAAGSVQGLAVAAVVRGADGSHQRRACRRRPVLLLPISCFTSLLFLLRFALFLLLLYILLKCHMHLLLVMSRSRRAWGGTRSPDKQI
jgi:hypothetical protein